MPQGSRRISLEIDEKEGPLHGRVAEAGGSSREFEGWLGLLTILGHLLDPPPASDGESAPPTTSPL